MYFPVEDLAQASNIEAELVRIYGKHTLAFFGLAPENLHFIAPGGEGLVNYRLVKNVAVVLGDPICEPGAFERVTRSFLNLCLLRGWCIAFYQVSSEYLAAYRRLKLHTFKIGEEAIIDPQSFTLRGAAMEKVRAACNHAKRVGLDIQWYEGVPPAEVLCQLKQLSDTWLEHKAGKHAAEAGFSVGRLDELATSAARADAIAESVPSADMTPRLITGVVTTSSGKACAFMTFTPIYGVVTTEAKTSEEQSGEWGWALDLMRRAPDAPRGAMELLLVRAIERFKVCGAQRFSLAMVSMADTKQEMPAGQRLLVHWVMQYLHLLEYRHTLFRFKEKFHPCWESRYVVTDATLTLPRVALAILHVRNYAGGGLVNLMKWGRDNQ